jgi:transcription initiation factor TFIID subunit 6
MNLNFPKGMRRVGESVRSLPVSDQALSALGPDAEYRVKEIIQDALKIMRHGKREVLSAEDVNQALRLRNTDEVYGLRGYEMHLGKEKRYRPDADQRFCWAEDDVLTLADVIAAPVAPCPLEVSLTAHWLAVEGVQPAIPQNPGLSVIRKKPAATAASTAPPGVEVRPPVAHSLSKELQLYFEKVCKAACETAAPNWAALQEAAFKSLRSDAGLTELTPYFSQRIADGINSHLRDLPLLTSYVRMLMALLSNPHLSFEHYLQQLLPAVITCMVCRELCASAAEDHWALRELAADALALIVAKFGQPYPSILPMAAQVLLEAFCDRTKALTTHYGAVAGLTRLGPAVVNRLLLPALPAYAEPLRAARESRANPAMAAEAEKVFDALTRAVGSVLQDQARLAPLGLETKGGLSVDYTFLSDMFGSALQQFAPQATDQMPF